MRGYLWSNLRTEVEKLFGKYEPRSWPKCVEGEIRSCMKSKFEVPVLESRNRKICKKCKEQKPQDNFIIKRMDFQLLSDKVETKERESVFCHVCRRPPKVSRRSSERQKLARKMANRRREVG